MYPDITGMRERLEALEAKDRAASNAAKLALEAALAARCEVLEARFKLFVSFDDPLPGAGRCRRDLTILAARKQRGCLKAVQRAVDVSALSRFLDLMLHG